MKSALIGHRRALGQARAAVQADGEGWLKIAIALEDLGGWLAQKKEKGCTGFEQAMTQIKDELYEGKVWPALGSSEPLTGNLIERIRLARNAAVHEGAMARNVAGPAIKLALIVEEGLMAKVDSVKDIRVWMVPSPVVAENWHTLSQIRGTMIASGYSDLPFWDKRDQQWKLVHDLELVAYIAKREKANMGESLAQAIEDKDGTPRLQLLIAKVMCSTGTVQQARCKLVGNEGRPVLIVNSDNGTTNGQEQQLEGIVTAHDLLIS